jgi:hypothetical protein
MPTSAGHLKDVKLAGEATSVPSATTGTALEGGRVFRGIRSFAKRSVGSRPPNPHYLEEAKISSITCLMPERVMFLRSFVRGEIREAVCIFSKIRWKSSSSNWRVVNESVVVAMKTIYSILENELSELDIVAQFTRPTHERNHSTWLHHTHAPLVVGASFEAGRRAKYSFDDLN